MIKYTQQDLPAPPLRDLLALLAAICVSHCPEVQHDPLEISMDSVYVDTTVGKRIATSQSCLLQM